MPATGRRCEAEEIEITDEMIKRHREALASRLLDLRRAEPEELKLISDEILMSTLESPSRALARPLAADQAWSHQDDEGAEWLLLRLASPTNNPIARCRLLEHQPVRLAAAGDLTVTLDFTPIRGRAEKECLP